MECAGLPALFLAAAPSMPASQWHATQLPARPIESGGKPPQSKIMTPFSYDYAGVPHDLRWDATTGASRFAYSPRKRPESICPKFAQH